MMNNPNASTREPLKAVKTVEAIICAVKEVETPTGYTTPRQWRPERARLRLSPLIVPTEGDFDIAVSPEFARVITASPPYIVTLTLTVHRE